MIYDGVKYFMVVAKHPEKDIITLWSTDPNKLAFNVKYVDCRPQYDKDDKPKYDDYVCGKMTKNNNGLPTFFITHKCRKEVFI